MGDGRKQPWGAGGGRLGYSETVDGELLSLGVLYVPEDIVFYSGPPGLPGPTGAPGSPGHMVSHYPSSSTHT